jgi:hypothetical protein
MAVAYREAASNTRPKLLGLTASPGELPEDIAQLANELGARYLLPQGNVLAQLNQHVSQVYSVFVTRSEYHGYSCRSAKGSLLRDAWCCVLGSDGSVFGG